MQKKESIYFVNIKLKFIFVRKYLAENVCCWSFISQRERSGSVYSDIFTIPILYIL